MVLTVTVKIKNQVDQMDHSGFFLQFEQFVTEPQKAHIVKYRLFLHFEHF